MAPFSVFVAYLLWALALFAGRLDAQRCYYPSGDIASESVPCKSNSTVSSCCPRPNANDLYPLDYPVCQPSGLCQAGNSMYLARDACTDQSWTSSECTGFCRNDNRTGITGVTDCGASSGWMCCDLEHDSGACSCDPPSGNAFKVGFDKTPQYFSSLPSSSSNSSPTTSPSSPPSSSSSNSSPTASPSSPPSLVSSASPSSSSSTTSTSKSCPASLSSTASHSSVSTSSKTGLNTAPRKTYTSYIPAEPTPSSISISSAPSLSLPMISTVFAQTLTVGAASSASVGTSAATALAHSIRLPQLLAFSTGVLAMLYSFRFL